jgi:hypothetical protein
MRAEMIPLWAIPLGSVAATLLLWGCYVALVHLRQARKRPDAPVPAEDPSLAWQPIERAALRVRTAVALVVAAPLVAATICGAVFATHDGGPATTAALGLSGGGGALWAYALYRWRAAVRRLKQAQWHREARAMVGRAVGEIRHANHVAFHGVAVDDGTIDHLVVGPKGVFAIQTLVTPAPARAGGRSGDIVAYDGRGLRFPHGEDHGSIRHADALAEQLSRRLSEQLGAPVAARAVVALPGWRVKRISAEGISVVQPAQLASFFEHVKPRPLSEDAIHQIALLLDPNGRER